MAIKNIKERLEGSYRLIRVRRIKRIFFAVQLIIAIILGMLVSYFMGASFDPFYFPVDVFSFILLVIVLILSVEAIYFKGIEIKYTRNKSRRYLLARNAIRRSIGIIAVAGFLMFMMLLPLTQEYITDTHPPSSPNDGVPVSTMDNASIAFKTQGSLGMARTGSIEINTGLPCDVTIYRNSINNVPIMPTQEGVTQFQWNGLADYSSEMDEIIVVVHNPNPLNTSFEYSVSSGISPFISIYLPAIGIAFIIVQLISISIMYPIRETYASSSIYSKKYVAKTDSGEYAFSGKELTKKDKEEQELLDSTLDIDVAAPKAKSPAKRVAQPPPPPEEVEMARAKGKVDEDLIEEPDVKCPNCGAMNSAHAAICFSCGEAMGAAEVLKVIDPEEYLRKGMRFAGDGKYEESLAFYDEVLKQDRGNERAMVLKGKALFGMGKWGSAVQYVNTALQVNPENIEALLLKAEILEDRDRLNKAMEVYSQILSIEPSNETARAKIEQVSQEAAMESVEDVLEQFMCVPGIGLAKATALYENGFTGIKALKDASISDLAGVKGISDRLAKKIKKGLEGL